MAHDDTTIPDRRDHDERAGQAPTIRTRRQPGRKVQADLVKRSSSSSSISNEKRLISSRESTRSTLPHSAVNQTARNTESAPEGAAAPAQSATSNAIHMTVIRGGAERRASANGSALPGRRRIRELAANHEANSIASAHPENRQTGPTTGKTTGSQRDEAHAALRSHGAPSTRDISRRRANRISAKAREADSSAPSTYAHAPSRSNWDAHTGLAATSTNGVDLHTLGNSRRAMQSSTANRATSTREAAERPLNAAATQDDGRRNRPNSPNGAPVGGARVGNRVSSAEMDAARRRLGVRAAVSSFATSKDARGSLRDRLSGTVFNHRAALVVMACVVACLLALYAPLRDWYVAYRHGASLETRYDALSRENANLEHEVSRLQTREGIEDEARRRGYVSTGETGVTVVGAPTNEQDDEQMAESDEENTDATDNAANSEQDNSGTTTPSDTDNTQSDSRTMGTRVLDFLFGYEATS